MKFQELNTKANNIARRYLFCEKELLQVISVVDRKKAYRYWGYNSLFSYLTKGLELSPGVASNFSAVARKSLEVPELKTQVLQGKMSIHQARRVTSVITPQNKTQWLQKASTHSQRQLEREVSLANPKAAVRETSRYVPAHKEVKKNFKILQKVARIQLVLGVSEKTMIRLRRAQDLESQRQKRNASLEDTLNVLIETYLYKKDPIEKAKRQKIRGKLEKIRSFNEDVPIEPTSSSAPPQKTTACKSKFLEDRENRRANFLTESENSIPSKTPSRKVTKKSQKRSVRKPIPAKIRHQIQLRDGGQCRFEDEKGLRCSSRRYLEIHHIVKVSNGGLNTPENLITLCSGHHKAQHLSL